MTDHTLMQLAERHGAAIRLILDEKGAEAQIARQGEAVQRLPLPFGRQSLPLRRSPPSPLELEQAIAEVEDVLMAHLPLLPRGAVLLLESKEPLSGQLGGSHFTLAQIERLFQQFAAMAEGDPLAAGQLPIHPGFAATLLILREWMHHLDAPEVTLMP